MGIRPATNVCRQVSRAIENTLRRPGDIVARYGGEEFAVLLPNTDESGAAMMADRIRRAVLALAIDHDASPADNGDDQRRRRRVGAERCRCGLGDVDARCRPGFIRGEKQRAKCRCLRFQAWRARRSRATQRGVTRRY